MIILKCDICKKNVDKIETIVLYKTSVDYCSSCKSKATKMKTAMENAIDYCYKGLEENLKQSEKNILSRRYK